MLDAADKLADTVEAVGVPDELKKDKRIVNLAKNTRQWATRLREHDESELQLNIEKALIELFRKQRPGEPPSVDGAKNLLNQLFFDRKRYDLTRVGRYKLNSRLGLDEPLDQRTLTQNDIIQLIKELISLPKMLGIPETGEFENGEPIKDYAAEAISLPREPIMDHLDEYEHFGSRRLRTVGELIQSAFRVGLYRMERVVRERLTTEDADTITPQTIINIRPVVAALKEFFGSSQLSQFMDQTNSLSGLRHRRRLSALGAGGLPVGRPPKEVPLSDVAATQIWSVTTALVPFLEHDGANRALMGSNMQAQAVPLLKPEAPLVGTGMERRAAIDTGDVIVAEADGDVSYVDAEKVVVSHGSRKDEYELNKFMRSNQGTIIHPTP